MDTSYFCQQPNSPNTFPQQLTNITPSPVLASVDPLSRSAHQHQLLSCSRFGSCPQQTFPWSSELRTDFVTHDEPNLLQSLSKDFLRNSASQSTALTPTGVNVNGPSLNHKRPTNQQSWLHRNLDDPGLRSAARNRMTDGSLNRQDMVNIFERAEDGGRITRTEFEDLKVLVNNAERLGMPDYVHVLSHKVVNGDFANRNYQGKALGNLTAGSSATHLRALKDKWFFGGDHPIAQSYWDNTNYRYRTVNQPLFSNGISYKDIKQGSTGDCYFLAGLAATVLHDPNKLRSMFIDNQDGTYTVRFYQRNGQADYVTVDSALPISSWGQPVYADYSQELWVALAEKAYAQLNESGWIGHSDMGFDIRPEDDDTNSYEGISAGLPDEATAQITGQSMTWGFMKSESSKSIIDAFKAGEFVSFGTYKPISPRIVAGHAYTLVDYDPTSQKFTLYNPWGIDGGSGEPDGNSSDGKVELSWQALQNNFYSWYTNAPKSIA